MADILTHLRELSVGVAAYYKDDADSITPTNYLDICNSKIENTQRLTLNSISETEASFNETEMQTIKNGFKLFSILSKRLSFNNYPDIRWSGSFSQSDSTIDLTIDGIRLSLKEDSMILENMGLYKLINTLTGESKYSRGELHSFKVFANSEFEHWYAVTRNLAIDKLRNNPYVYNGEKYSTVAELTDNNSLYLKVSFKYGKSFESLVENFRYSNYEDFEKSTNGKTREKVFSKLIDSRIKSEPEYIKAKFECSDAAGKKIVSLLSGSIGSSSDSLARLFRIEEEEYYYAKITNKIHHLYKVPSKENFERNIIIDEVSSSIPTSQLNIHTVIKNILTNGTIKFENQIRYSHGQLNGTPEAKLYIKHGDLSVVYQPIV